MKRGYCGEETKITPRLFYFSLPFLYGLIGLKFAILMHLEVLLLDLYRIYLLFHVCIVHLLIIRTMIRFGMIP